ncbi:unnamed protein product [Rotaria sordida]|uniref:poly(ADP-ribose) glycohydrolase n=1 Tax=Rotaria sordida TaxID=392033 RepID=A0A814L3P2_9BILA|nr:unnamed protein product [Rotaria sordida]
MAESSSDLQQHVEEVDNAESNSEENLDIEIVDPCLNDEGALEIVTKGTPLETILNIHPQPPCVKDMEQIQHNNFIFMISPFKYDPLNPEREPITSRISNRSINGSDANLVFMPCSPHNVTDNKRSIWLLNRQSLINLKNMCDHHMATIKDLKKTIRECAHRHYNLDCLQKLIDDVYSNDERAHFMSTVLSNICTLALNVDTIFSRPLPLLRIGTNRSVTMSQQQAASLLACAFFCLFPNRSDYKQKNKRRSFPNPNFNALYQSGHPKKIQKLKCILHYFRRITEKMPNGIITIQRFALPTHLFPQWSDLQTGLCDLHLTTGKKIEDVNGALQVDFACKYIGGGVLGNGCVQEEIRFTICPEMLVSLLVCERMEPNECIFLIGCERYSSYRGYANSFQFDGDYIDNTPKDNWGRKWSHLVAMDAICFRDPSTQYDMECVDRELLKAYTSFRPLEEGSDYEFAIVTGNWGCGAFHGDKYVKAIIQLMAASEARRPLIYAAYHDKTLIDSLDVVYDYLKDQKATIGDLYQYLKRYFTQMDRGSLFEYILNTPVSFIKS